MKTTLLTIATILIAIVIFCLSDFFFESFAVATFHVCTITPVIAMFAHNVTKTLQTN